MRGKKTTIQQICDQLAIPLIEDAYVNPLRLALTYEFGRKCPSNYRTRAINRCLHNGVNFSSECNTIVEMALRVLIVKCPECGRAMRYCSSSGTGHMMSVRWRCSKDKNVVCIDLPSDSISVEFKENE